MRAPPLSAASRRCASPRARGESTPWMPHECHISHVNGENATRAREVTVTGPSFELAGARDVVSNVVERVDGARPGPGKACGPDESAMLTLYLSAQINCTYFLTPGGRSGIGRDGQTRDRADGRTPRLGSTREGPDRRPLARRSPALRLQYRQRSEEEARRLHVGVAISHELIRDEEGDHGGVRDEERRHPPAEGRRDERVVLKHQAEI